MLIAFQIGLKSNMDRFIGGIGTEEAESLISLKSNMDRFIVFQVFHREQEEHCLKSNMDRFIVTMKIKDARLNAFKIQYG